MRSTTILDGGMGHELKSRIVSRPGQEAKFFLAGNLANCDESDEVVRLHREYLEAGAGVITTNNFVTTPYSLAKCGLEGRFDELTRAAGRCARRAVEEHARAGGPGRGEVAGCLPPLVDGYLGELVMEASDMKPVYGQMVRLLEPYCDLFLAETLSTSGEALCVVEAVAEHGCGKPLWIAWTLHDTLDASLRGGEAVGDAVDKVLALGSKQVGAVLLNCCVPQSIEAALPLLRARLPPSTRAGAYANAFQQSTSEWLASPDACGYVRGRCRVRGDAPKLTVDTEYDTDGLIEPGAYGDHALRWQTLGADIVGGCCGVCPRHIAAIKSSLASAVHPSKKLRTIAHS